MAAIAQKYACGKIIIVSENKNKHFIIILYMSYVDNLCTIKQCNQLINNKQNKPNTNEDYELNLSYQTAAI